MSWADPETQRRALRPPKSANPKKLADRTVRVSQRNIDMLESAVSQLVLREPRWTETARVFAEEARLLKTLKVIESLKETARKRQQEMFE